MPITQTFIAKNEWKKRIRFKMFILPLFLKHKISRKYNDKV